MTNLPTLIRYFFLLSVLGLTGISSGQAAQGDPDLVLGPKACANCHKSSIRAWKKTHHFATFKTLTRDDAAKDIAKKMGIKRMKSESDCVSCHFTTKKKGSRIRAVAGISCESCHGPAKNWMDIHSDFGGKGVKAKDETPEHKVTRYAESEKNGMIRPKNLYNVGKNCYSCHTVPNEKLVNVGGHAAGSEFELVQWSQGEVRHNVWYDESTNNPSSPERLRIMYVTGKALDLEYALHGLAKATEDKEYFKSMVKRQDNALNDLKKIAGIINAPQIKSMIAAVNSKDLKINNAAALTAAANAVGKAAQDFAQQYDGSQFAAIDSLLPKPDSYQGKVYQP